MGHHGRYHRLGARRILFQCHRASVEPCKSSWIRWPTRPAFAPKLSVGTCSIWHIWQGIVCFIILYHILIYDSSLFIIVFCYILLYVVCLSYGIFYWSIYKWCIIYITVYYIITYIYILWYDALLYIIALNYMMINYIVYHELCQYIVFYFSSLYVVYFSFSNIHIC